jgi:4-amino-4-deoxy-L-arabinose transferase-like glycosyltransferase
MGVRGGLARFGLGLASILFATGLLIMLLAHFLTRTLNHDEHQFVASGVLWARNGLLPYQDYAYFHVPFLTLIYAALFSLTDYFLLAARGFSTLCSWLLLLTLFGMARHHLRQRPWTGFAVGVGVALFLVAAPLFIYTSGRAWNHDLPILLTVWAVLVHLRGLDQQTQRWFWLSGLLIGLACATRLSFVPFLLPLGLAIWLWPGPAGWRARLLPTFGFGGGLLLGVAPALLFFILDPAGFWFGNFEYARLNTIYRITIGYERRMNLATKLAAFGDELLLREPGNLLILLTYLWLGRPRWGAGARVRARQLLLAGVILAALIGALAPTPSWPQYFYVLMPLLLLATLYGLVTERRVWLDQPWFGGVALAIVTAAIVLTAKEYEHVRKVFQPPSWFPVEFHATGQAMAALAGRGGPVLTLAPILALEGGLSIYAEMATGPFALRAAQLLPAAAGPGLHLPNVRTLDQWLQPQPPQAILTGVHPNQVADEAPLVDYARRQGY